MKANAGSIEARAISGDEWGRSMHTKGVLQTVLLPSAYAVHPGNAYLCLSSSSWTFTKQKRKCNKSVLNKKFPYE